MALPRRISSAPLTFSGSGHRQVAPAPRLVEVPDRHPEWVPGRLIMVWSPDPDGRLSCRWVDPNALGPPPSLRVVRPDTDPASG
jgi:hypothetical protein